MTQVKPIQMALNSQDDVVSVRQAVRSAAVQLGLNLIDQTKIVTAASELARNTVIHGKGGFAFIETVQETGKHGIRLTFEDRGPGIADLERAMTDGFTSGGGLGLGLGGSKRLASDFSIQSKPGEGTRVVITRWKS